MEPLTPVYTAALFAPLHDRLIALLEQLAPGDWEMPTIAGAWQVRDVAAHLLDGDLRRLSAGRDGHLAAPGRAIGSYADLVAFLNELNASWVAAARRFSPRVLTDLLRTSGAAVASYVVTLPPHDAAPFPVAWAGERQSEHWFDIGRDFTERWHHQMQIRDAVGAPPLYEREFLLPLLDLSVRSLPRAYAGTSAPIDASVVLRIGTDAGAVWTVRRSRVPGEPGTATPGETGWEVMRGAAPAPAAAVHLDPDSAWRLFYNAWHPDEARRRAAIEGDALLVEPLFGARSVMV